MVKKYCNVCIYESLPHEKLNISKNNILFHEGDEIENVFHIDFGYVKVLKYHESGDEKIFDILGPGEFMGLLLVLQEKKNFIVTAIALSDVVIRKIKIQDVRNAYLHNTTFQQTCLKCATARANVFQNQLYQISSSEVDDKILGVLMYLYRKFGEYKEHKHLLYLPINQSELASIIGIRRETLSRRIKLLQDEGVISIHKHIYQFNKV